MIDGFGLHPLWVVLPYMGWWFNFSKKAGWESNKEQVSKQHRYIASASVTASSFLPFLSSCYNFLWRTVLWKHKPNKPFLPQFAFGCGVSFCSVFFEEDARRGTLLVAFERKIKEEGWIWQLYVVWSQLFFKTILYNLDFKYCILQWQHKAHLPIKIYATMSTWLIK